MQQRTAAFGGTLLNEKSEPAPFCEIPMKCCFQTMMHGFLSIMHRRKRQFVATLKKFLRSDQAPICKKSEIMLQNDIVRFFDQLCLVSKHNFTVFSAD